MKTTVNYDVLRYPPVLLLLGLLGLSGCAPISPYPAPGQGGQQYAPPAARPLPKQAAPPAQRRPLQQTYVPPALSPVPEQRQQVAVTRPLANSPQPNRRKPARPSQPEQRSVQKTVEAPVSRPAKPDVAYIPDKPQPQDKPADSTSMRSTVTVTTKPFWEEEGKVEVEVVDLKKSTAPDSTGNNDTDNAENKSGSDMAVTGSISGASSSPVVIVLMKQANNELVAGKPDRAATTLERALRIAPNDPNLWLRLAEVNAQQGNKGQAASMARKALDLSPDDLALRQRGQRLLN